MQSSIKTKDGIFLLFWPIKPTLDFDGCSFLPETQQAAVEKMLRVTFSILSNAISYQYLSIQTAFE
jgi:hypothetical protein